MMGNRNIVVEHGLRQDRASAIYNSVKNLYDQAKRIWRSAVFEVILEPIEQEYGEHRVIDIPNFVPGVDNEDDVDRAMTLHELFREIKKLQDYKHLLDTATLAIERVREEYNHKYKINLKRIVYPPDQLFEPEAEFEREPEQQFEEDVQWEPDREQESDLDSGQDSQSELGGVLNSESELPSEWESDSGKQTESEYESEWRSDWETDSETEPPTKWVRDTESEVKFESESELNSDLYSESESESNAVYLSPIKVETEHKPTFEDKCDEEFPKLVLPYGEILILGPNGTFISRLVFEAIPWKTAAGTTRALMSLLFGDHILATHTLNGKPGIHGLDKGENELNPRIMADIIYIICSQFEVNQKEVRSIIAVKWADARKKYQRKAAKFAIKN